MMSKRKPSMRKDVSFIIVNDTRKPRTGGDYVYSVMKDELIKRGYRVNELSIPILISTIRHSSASKWIGQASLSPSEILAYVKCYLVSLRRYKMHGSIVITSSCPTFPVLGHLTYHQPKAGIFARSIRETGKIRRVIGYKVEEDERFSPLWLLAKKLIRLHLSNSEFTKELVRKMYKVDSRVLYPPIPTSKYDHLNDRKIRRPCVLLTRPETTTGISSLSRIASSLPKSISFLIIGNVDKAGKKALHDLGAAGITYKYLGFVNEATKVEAFKRSSVYLNLARNETFGMSVVEALASGCIPIAHKSGAIPEYLPKELTYSEIGEIPEKLAAYVDANEDFRKRLKEIALRFDEGIFRERFMHYFETLNKYHNFPNLETREHI